MYYDSALHFLLLTCHIYLSVATVINSMKTKALSEISIYYTFNQKLKFSILAFYFSE